MQSMPPPPNSLFQSTLPGWGATLHSSICTADDPFQSTLPGWGATFQCLRSRQSFAISIHAPRMGSDPPTGCDSRYTQTISIHAPRMGSDLRRVLSCRFCGISIHAPRMGSDLPIRLLALPFAAFQSTLPGWGATGAKGDTGPTGQISIHAPRMGSDPAHPVAVREPRVISIHAPRMGSDTRRSARRPKGCHFNPRSPDGERP